MAADPIDAMQHLTDPESATPTFFLAGVPWTRTTEDSPPPTRRITVNHVTDTLAEYATLDQLDRHLGPGYTSLLIGQRVGLVRAGDVIRGWPDDDTGRPWTGHPSGRLWAFHLTERVQWGRPGSAAGIIVGEEGRGDPLTMAYEFSTISPDATIVVARECLWDAHWH